MPPDGWPIEQIAAVIGADADKMRRFAIRFLLSLKQGRLVTTDVDVERLLKSAAQYGSDPVQAFDRWFGDSHSPQPSDASATAGIEPVQAPRVEYRRPGAQQSERNEAEAAEPNSANAPFACLSRSIENLGIQLERMNGLLERLAIAAEHAGKSSSED